MPDQDAAKAFAQNSQQLVLDLEKPEVPKLCFKAEPEPVQPVAQVVTFTDLPTRLIRRQAMERLKASGIFPVPKPSK